MRTKMSILVLSLLLATLVGCGGGNDSAGPVNTELELAGTWSFDVQTKDGFLRFQNPLIIVGDGPVFSLCWNSAATNGTASLDLNTKIIMMDMDTAELSLRLDGTVAGNNSMSGQGTISGYGGIRLATWRATR
ncbi:MAG: hypothetical protein WCL44_10020 [bacterium]